MLFSIVTPIYNPPKDFFHRAINSIIDQDFNDWEWILVNDDSIPSKAIDEIELYSNNSKKINFLSNKNNRNISYSTNKAITASKGEWIVFFDQDDLLDKSTLSIISNYLDKNPQAKVIYTDEDKINENDHHFDPYFKPDWNPALLRSQNYFCHLFAVEKKHLERCGKLREGYEGSQDWDLCLRLTSKLKPNEIVHIPQVLYHWRAHDGSTAKSVDAKGSSIANSSQKVLNEFLSITRTNATVENVDEIHWNVKMKLSSKQPSLLLVLVEKSNSLLSKKNIRKILHYSKYEGHINVINIKKSFYQKLLFRKRDVSVALEAKRRKCDFICILSSEVNPIKKSWIIDMVANALDDQIGFCGPKLVQKEKGTIASCGLIADADGFIKSIYESCPIAFPGDKYRAKLKQNLTFIHPSCLVGRSELFDESFDPFSFSSVMEACLSLHLTGLRNLFVPEVEMDITNYSKTCYNYSDNIKIRDWFKKVSYDPSLNPNLTIKNGLPHKINT